MNKITEFLKKHKSAVALIVLWIVALILSFASKATESVGGWLLLVALIATVVVGVNAHKKKKVSTATAAPPAPVSQLPRFPDRITENGNEFNKAYEYSNVEIYGVEYCSQLPMNAGEGLLVLPEPTNKADPEAVVIMAVRGQQTYKIGYLPRDNRLKHMVNDYYKKDGRVKAFIDNPSRYTMSMAFYKKRVN